MQHVQSNIPGECPGAETSMELGICEPSILSARKSKNVVQKVKNGHKNPNDSHNYHNGIKLYKENNNRST